MLLYGILRERSYKAFITGTTGKLTTYKIILVNIKFLGCDNGIVVMRSYDSILRIHDEILNKYQIVCYLLKIFQKKKEEEKGAEQIKQTVNW